MSDTLEEIKLNLKNDKVKFEAYSTAHPDMKIFFDYKQPIGDGNGFNGLELLLLSLSGCSATAVVHLLKKMKKEVAEFKVFAKGERTSAPPVKFKKIKLVFVLGSTNTTIEELKKCISMSEDSVCPVWQMIKNNVEVETEAQVVQGGLEPTILSLSGKDAL